jgi:hypothetical protein
VLPRQAAEEDRDAMAFGRGERALDRTMKVPRRGVRLRARLQPPAFLVNAPPNLFFDFLA